MILQKKIDLDLKCSVYIVRDDLYPCIGGGNKGRKIYTIGQEILEKNSNAVVTTGGIQSNHCRATALFCMEHGIACTLVLHGDREQFFEQSGNAKIMRMSGANIVFTEDPSQISTKMDVAMQEYQEKGLNPYYLWGGGHNIAGGKAYIDAVDNLISMLKNHERPDYIFLACGTGSTQAGIMAGLSKHKWDSKVIGISIARRSEYAEKHVCDFYNKLCVYYNIDPTLRTIVLDQYLCGGYEKFNDELKLFSEESIKKYGFILDTTYSGKAFWGMKQYILKNRLKGNILFWHTGGILNFLA